MKLIFLAALFLSASVNAEEWTRTEKILLASYIVMNAADVVQTRHIIDVGGGSELNPAFGSKPSTTRLIGLKAVVVGTLFLLADSSNSDTRLALLAAVNFVQFLGIRHNHLEIQFEM